MRPLTTSTSPSAQALPTDEEELAFLGVASQAELLRAGEVSPRQLVELYLSRIERLDPMLNAFRIVLKEQALEAADEAKARIEAGDQAPLLGVPIAVKDDIDVQGVSTMYGTGVDTGRASADAAVVRRLRGAGAIIIGKTHLPEFGQFPTCESATWGVTRNPWNPDHTPGGSSGGSAAAVAAGMVGAALGSDGGGSVRIPAACCGLVGLKGQRNRVSTLQAPEHLYRWFGLSAFGPITRNVLDSALLHDIMAGDEPDDPLPAPPPLERTLRSAVEQAPAALRIALSFKPVLPGIAVDEEVRRPVRETAELLRSLGHEVIERDPDYPKAAVAITIALYTRGAAEEFPRGSRTHRLERRTQAAMRTGRMIPAALAGQLQAARARISERMVHFFDDIDVLITPVLGKPPVELGHWEGLGPTRSLARSLGFIPFTPAQNFTGQPACAVPTGIGANGLPMAVHLVGRPNDEATLIALAAQLEAARPWTQWRPEACTTAGSHL